MKKGIKVKTLVIGIVVTIIVCTAIIILLMLKSNEQNQGEISSNTNEETVEQSKTTTQNSEVKVEDYEDEIKKIKFETKDGILYEDDEIKLTSFDCTEDEYNEEENSAAFDYDGDLNSIYFYNKTSSKYRCEIKKATMSGCSIKPSNDDEYIEPGEAYSFSFQNILYLSKVIQSMGIGAFNNIELELELNGNDIEEMTKKIEIKTDCKQKAKSFNIKDAKIYDKNGLKIFIDETYISDNTRIAERVKEQLQSDSYDGYYNNYFDDKVVQNVPHLNLIVENDNDEEKEIQVKVECDGKDVSSYYFGTDGDMQEETIEPNIIDRFPFFSMYGDGSWIEKDKQYNPNNIKYTIIVDGKKCYTVDFKDAKLQ